MMNPILVNTLINILAFIMWLFAIACGGAVGVLYIMYGHIPIIDRVVGVGIIDAVIAYILTYYTRAVRHGR